MPNRLHTIDTYDNLSDISVGDEVIVIVNGSYLRRQVERVTATQFTTSGGKRYLKRSGRRVGSDSPMAYDARAIYFTEERWMQAQAQIAKIKQEKEARALRNRLYAVKWNILPVEQLAAVADVLGIEHAVEVEDV
jgi:hypothetical protein